MAAISPRGRRRPRFALTFDDGPGPSTARLLDVLDAEGARATFFVLGASVEQAAWCGGDRQRARALVLRALGTGHVVGNHSFSHQRDPAPAAFARDVERCDRLLRGLRREAGLDPRAPIPLRLPYGVELARRVVPSATGAELAAVLDPRLAVLASLGRAHLHWTSLFGDWDARAGSAATLARRLLSHVEECAAAGIDAVLGLHDGGTGDEFGYDRSRTVAAVRQLLAEARRRGWRQFVVPRS